MLSMTMPQRCRVWSRLRFALLLSSLLRAVGALLADAAPAVPALLILWGQAIPSTAESPTMQRASAILLIR